MTTTRSKAIGSAAERYVAGMVGGRRIGQALGPVDVTVDGYLDLQVKALGVAPSLPAIRRALAAMPPGKLRGVVVLSRPGAGHPAEVTVTFDFREFSQWHGRPER